MKFCVGDVTTLTNRTLTMLDVADEIPCPVNKLPVPRKIFPVNLLRELLENVLQHSGFLLRYGLEEPRSRKIPCKIPC